MARTSRRSDFVSTITDTIASHPRLSAAVAFQMGVLLGQAMNNRAGAMQALRRGVGRRPLLSPRPCRISACSTEAGRNRRRSGSNRSAGAGEKPDLPLNLYRAAGDR